MTSPLCRRIRVIASEGYSHNRRAVDGAGLLVKA